jgi:hypothetical protein
MLKTQTQEGIPELYYCHTDKPNENTPLGWAESLFIVALHDMNQKFIDMKPIRTRGHPHTIHRLLKLLKRK